MYKSTFETTGDVTLVGFEWAYSGIDWGAMTVRGIYLSSKRTNVCNQLSSFLKWEEGVHQYNSIIEQIQCVCVYMWRKIQIHVYR